MQHWLTPLIVSIRSIFKLKINEPQHKMTFYRSNWSILNSKTQKSTKFSRAWSEQQQGLQKLWPWFLKEIYMVIHPRQNLKQS